jgi:NarL family two-component system response regulator LiaR
MKKIKVLIADDHAIVRNGLRALFLSTQDFTVTGEAADGETAIQMASDHLPDVAILDISMPKLDGIEATRIIKKEHPEIKVVILTIHDDEAYAYQIIRAGANGYILKNAERKEILTGVRAVAAGERFFSPSVPKSTIEKFLRRAEQERAEPAAAGGTLTKREQEVLQCIAQGLTPKEISEKLSLSLKTVNTYRASLVEKLGVEDTAGFVRYAIRSGLIKVYAS